MKTISTAALSLILCATACSAGPDAGAEGAGMAAVNLPLGEAEAESIIIVITGADMEDIVVELAILDDAAWGEMRIPAGPARTFTATATLVDGTECTGTTTVDVLPDVVIDVDLVLTCGADSTAQGGVNLNGSLNNAPVVTWHIVSPALLVAGERASLHMAVVDPDGDLLTIHWEAEHGTISSEGDSFFWTSPQVSGEFVVTGIATDALGASSSVSAVLTVVPPSLF